MYKYTVDCKISEPLRSQCTVIQKVNMSLFVQKTTHYSRERAAQSLCIVAPLQHHCAVTHD